jgi:hypothetical protein
MNNSSGIFQVDELLATKLRDSGLENHVDVIARIEGEHERRLVPIFRIGSAPDVEPQPPGE